MTLKEFDKLIDKKMVDKTEYKYYIVPEYGLVKIRKDTNLLKILMEKKGVNDGN